MYSAHVYTQILYSCGRVKQCVKNGWLETYILSSEEIFGEYQCGFRPGRSSADQIHLMRQTLERSYEYDITLQHLFIDFKQTFDRVSKSAAAHGLIRLRVPSKLVRLVQMTMASSKSVVSLQNALTEPFDINTGVRQGDAPSALFSTSLSSVLCVRSKSEDF